MELTSNTTPDVVEPSRVVEAMASAVDRLRRMASTVFSGDAALFEDTVNTANAANAVNAGNDVRE